jgi:hypothetical protein
MENNIAVRTKTGPPAITCLSTGTGAPDSSGGVFSTALAGTSRTNPFKDQLGEFSRDVLENLVKQFGDELKHAQRGDSDSSLSTGHARPINLEVPTAAKGCPEIVTEQTMVHGELKDVDFIILHGGCNRDNSNGSTTTGRADGSYGKIPSRAAPPPESRPDTALNPKMVEPESDSEALNYVKDSLEQVALGNYSDKVTLLGTGIQVATGFLGLDLPADIRDLSHDLTHWQWSWGHVGQTLLDGVGMLPVVGSIKYLDEAGALLKGAVKHVDETADMAKNAEKAIDKIGDIKRGVLKSEDANVLENLEKTEKKKYVRIGGFEGPKNTLYPELRSLGAAVNKQYDKLAKIANKAYGAKGKQASQLLQKMAEKAGLTVESGGKHLKVMDQSGNMVTTIPHSPHAKGTIKSIANAIMTAAGF